MISFSFSPASLLLSFFPQEPIYQLLSLYTFDLIIQSIINSQRRGLINFIPLKMEGRLIRRFTALVHTPS